MTDPISDLLTRIRNASSARHDTVSVPASKVKEAIVKLLKEAGYIVSYVIEEKKPQNEIKIFLKYDAKRKSVIHELKRVSKPGRRIYRGSKEIRPHLSGLGLRIISTPKGIVTDTEARKSNLGGEILCEVW